MNRREELLDLAGRVLETDGLEAFGIAALARAAGIKAPSLYKHFAGLEDIEATLISRGFHRLSTAFAAASQNVSGSFRDRLQTFVDIYRSQAREHPELYRLMTGRPLDRERLEPGAEFNAMAGIIALFGETAARHDTARAVWAWAHGLTILEITGRFPPDADLDAAWAFAVETLVQVGESRTGMSGRHDDTREPRSLT